MTSTNKAMQLESIRAPMQAVHDSGENLTYAWRKRELERLLRMVSDHREDFAGALKKDLGKSRVEAIGTEVSMVQGDVQYMLNNLREWMQPTEVPSPGVTLPSFSRVVPTPKTGPACLVFGPSNYPCMLSLKPAAGALAAGNPVVIKPSELAPATSQLLQDLCDRYFAKGVLRVVQGGVAESTQLLQEPWGLVLFTGSARVGKIVAQAAAKTLTPTVLELGGKCPCYVDETMPSDITQVANRITWAKTVNAGQTCAAIDTLIVHEKVVDELIPRMVESLRLQFPPPAIESELGRFRIQQHAQRLMDMIKEIESACSPENSNTRIVCGGSKACQPEKGYIEPTIVLNPPSDCRILREEIFGPILPVVTVKSRREAIRFMQNDLPGTPLCLYVFTKHQSVFEEVRQACPAGSVMRNDALMHLGSPCIPFGGLGTSGYGNYFGRHSFDAFSHKQAIMYRPCAPGLDCYRARYHPFGDEGLKAWLVTHVLVRLPIVPVLHVRKILYVLVILAALRMFDLPGTVLIRSEVARMLHQVASWLEESENVIA